jgi:hypothetical protein
MSSVFHHFSPYRRETSNLLGLVSSLRDLTTHSMLTRRFGRNLSCGRGCHIQPLTGRNGVFSATRCQGRQPESRQQLFCSPISTPDGILEIYHFFQLSSHNASCSWNCTVTPKSGCQEPPEAMPRHHFHPHNHQRWEMLPEVRDAGSTSPFRKPRRRARFAPTMQG